MRRMICLLIPLVLAAWSCDKADSPATSSQGQLSRSWFQLNGAPDPPGAYGVTTSVVISVNPLINEGTTAPIHTGTLRGGLTIQVSNLPPVITDSTGLAVVAGVPVGSNTPIVVEGDTLYLDIAHENDLYDLAISFIDGSAEYIIPPVRHAYLENVVPVEPGDDLSALMTESNMVVVLAPGIYEGDLEVRGQNIIIFGAWSEITGPGSVIDGNVTVYGNSIRIRGVGFTGDLRLQGNSFAAAYCSFEAGVILGNVGVLLRSSISDGPVNVTSPNAVLLENNIEE